jgi:hypothetical protein
LISCEIKSSITNNNNLIDNINDNNSNINDVDTVKKIVYVPQLLPVLFKILETVKNSEIIEKVCNKIDRCLTPFQIDHINSGNSKYLNKSLASALASPVILSNIEAIFNQKDWFASMCSCIVVLRGRILKLHEEEREHYYDMNGNDSNNYDTSDTKSESESSINEEISFNGSLSISIYI